MSYIKNIISILLLASLFLTTTAVAYATTHKYDSQNRLIETIYDSGVTARYTYDALGNITAVFTEQHNRVPVTFTVINLAQLRAALEEAQADDTIIIDANITLPSGQTLVLAVDGATQAAPVTILVNAGRRHLYVNGELILNDGIVLTRSDDMIAVGTNGGGIQVNNNGVFNMNGGEISSNKANNGGGIENSGEINMSGGTISGNTVANVGGGVRTYSYNFPKSLDYIVDFLGLPRFFGMDTGASRMPIF